jgi:hypothetical protein
MLQEAFPGMKRHQPQDMSNYISGFCFNWKQILQRKVLKVSPTNP